MMKGNVLKGIALSTVILFIMVSSANAVVISQLQPLTTGIEITKVRGGLGVQVTLKNNGTSTINNIGYTITVENRRKELKNASDDISSLDADKQKTVRSGMFYGFGQIDITVNVTWTGGTSYKNVYNGFVIGPLIIIR